MRGVNKLVLEIKNPEGDYFEKALLFVKPDKAYCSQTELNENADKLLEAVKKKRTRKRHLPLIIFGSIGAVSVVAGGILLFFC